MCRRRLSSKSSSKKRSSTRFQIPFTEVGLSLRLPPALGSEGLFYKILADKTITEIPRAKKNRVDGPTGAAKWDVTSTEKLALFKNREEEKKVQ